MLTKQMRDKLLEEKSKFIDAMCSTKIHDDEYNDFLKKVKDIDSILDKNKEHCFYGIKPDTLLVVGANLLGILLILNFEKADILTSKAMACILKGKV